jgi:hypothetical protein
MSKLGQARFGITTLFALVAFVALATGEAAAVSFDFEDLPNGTNVQAQYGPRGLIFPGGGAYVVTDPHARSGTRVLRSIAPNAEVFTPAPLVMTFTSPQNHVAFFASNYTGGTGQGTLKVFGANSAVLGQDGPKTVPADSFTASFDVRVPAGGIVRAEFQIENSALELIDDLVVEGTTSVGTSTPPRVAFTNPPNNAALSPGPVVLRGTVTGDGLLDQITLRVAFGLPDGSTAPPSTNTVTLTGSGTSRTFALNYSAITGVYAVTAVALNSSNLQGTATIRFTALPDAIRARYTASGGVAVFGNLRFGAGEAGCVAAIYDKGLIAAVGSTTFIVKGQIFQKWMATREGSNPMSKLGCPSAEERAALAGARAQDFKHGRIYANAGTTAYVPEVFRDAIETLGGEAATGVAVTDPTDSTAAMQTWLFQRFARLDNPSIEPSTLEVRGSPPVLYVERVGEGLVESTGLPLYSTTATVFRTFLCNGNLGPCNVQKPTSAPPIPNTPGRCPGTYDAVDYTIEWQWVTGGNYNQTSVLGWVTSSGASCSDNPLTHDYTITNNSPLCSVKDVFPSDWSVKLVPLAPFGNVLLAGQKQLEVEFEEHYALYFFAGWGWPTAGNLILTNGRHIFDCGHTPYNTEIHPPYLTSHIATRRRDDGTLETVADIWVNGYFPGDPIDVNLWPPPRPTPDSYLTVTRPTDDAALGVSVATTTSYSGARARFTASHHEVPVDRSGKMNWSTGRGYEGEWTLYWSRLP